MEQSKFNLVDRKILRTFDEIEDAICNLRDLISHRGNKTSNLAWFPKIRECEKQLSKLFVTNYAAEVFFRNPEDSNTNFDLMQ